MSVIKNLRSLSKMEFYHTALVLRDRLTKWLMKEFGIKPSYKEYELRASDISPEDIAVIDSIYEKYGINRKKAYASVYPQWLSEDEKLYFIRMSRDMVREIVMANSIYPICREEAVERRIHQDRAISLCFSLVVELQSLASNFPVNLNELVEIIETADSEIEYLKGWRKSDNKRKLI